MISSFSPLSQLASSALRNPLQDALKALGVNTGALENAAQKRGAQDAAGFQQNLFEAFRGVQPDALKTALAQPFAVQTPDAAMAQQAARSSQTTDLLGKVAGAAGGFALGGPLGAAAGVGLASAVSHLKAKVAQARMQADPGFRAQFEAQQQGRFVPDGRNDGQLTVAPRQFGVPGLGLGAGILGGLGMLGGGTAAASALSGLARMQDNVAGSLGRMTGLQLDPQLGMLGTPRGGRSTASLGAGATFEDLVAAFMADTVEKSQKEIQGQMRDLEKSNNSGGQGQKTMAGGVGGMLGGMAGGMLGGGAGQALGQAAGNALQGGGGGESAENSRQMMMEKLKNSMNVLQQMQQAMSNVLNTMHSGAMNSVRNIKA